MGAQVRYGTIAVGAYMAHQPASRQAGFDGGQHQGNPHFDYVRRSPRTWKDRNRWFSAWSYGCRTGGGDLEGYSVSGQGGLTVPDMYEPYSCDGDGCQTLKFIKGQAVDASDAALSGVTVQAFRSSDDAFAGYEVQSRQDGSYDLPTNFPGVSHYVVAYLPGSPDRGGTTVNTLVPANIDGT